MSLNLFSPDFHNDPYATYRNLLARSERIIPVPYLGAAWAFPRHSDIWLLLRDPRCSCRRASFLTAQFEPGQRERLRDFETLFSRWMLFFDAPEHTAPRRVLASALFPQAAWRPAMEAIVEELLDPICEKGSADIVQEIARPFPALVIAALMGVPRSAHREIITWSDDIATFFGNAASTFEQAAQAQAGLQNLTDFLTDLIRRRRLSRGNDLISELLRLEDGGTLDEDLVAAQCAMLFFAGHETTRNLIANALIALLRHPNELTALRQNPALYATAIDELARFDSPVQIGTRMLLDPAQIHGQDLPQGSLLLFLFGAANHDPAEFDQPHRLNLARSPNRHVSFATGAHRCAGAALARLECEIVLRAVLGRCERLELAEHQIEWMQNFGFRGPRAVPVVFQPRHPCGAIPDKEAAFR
jgi:cytochrome P450